MGGGIASTTPTGRATAEKLSCAARTRAIMGSTNSRASAVSGVTAKEEPPCLKGGKRLCSVRLLTPDAYVRYSHSGGTHPGVAKEISSPGTGSSIGSEPLKSQPGETAVASAAMMFRGA
jgi:hypothetical protein